MTAESKREIMPNPEIGLNYFSELEGAREIVEASRSCYSFYEQLLHSFGEKSYREEETVMPSHTGGTWTTQTEFLSIDGINTNKGKIRIESRRNIQDELGPISVIFVDQPGEYGMRFSMQEGRFISKELFTVTGKHELSLGERTSLKDQTEIEELEQVAKELNEFLSSREQ